MDIFEAIHNRRSIRKYTERPLTQEQLEKILRATMTAPSAGNAQPWQFVVVKNKKTLARLHEYNPYAAMAKDAPLGILVCGDLSKEKYPGFWVQDCSAAIQNLLLATHALGLGAVWTGIHPVKEREIAFQKEFELPAQIIPLAFIVIGHPAQNSLYKDRYLPERIHEEKWTSE